MATAKYQKFHYGTAGANTFAPSGNYFSWDQHAQLPQSRNVSKKCILEFKISDISSDTHVENLGVQLGWCLDGADSSILKNVTLTIELYDGHQTSLTELKKASPSETGLIGKLSKTSNLESSGPTSSGATWFYFKDVNINKTEKSYFLYCYLEGVSDTNYNNHDIVLWPGDAASDSNYIIVASHIACYEEAGEGEDNTTERIVLTYALDPALGLTQGTPSSPQYVLPYSQFVKNSDDLFNYADHIGGSGGLLSHDITFNVNPPTNYYADGYYAWVDAKDKSFLYGEWGPANDKGAPYDNLGTHKQMFAYLNKNRNPSLAWGDVVTLLPNFVCQISYDANGGNNAPEATVKTNYYKSVTLSNAVPTKTNGSFTTTVTYNSNGGSSVTANKITNSISYAFSKWNTESNGSGTSYNKGASYSDSGRKGNITLYAQYTATNSYKSINLPAAPTKNGYNFKGWYDSASGGTKIGDAGASYTPKKDTTLYAQWQVSQYTVTIVNGSYGTVKSGSTTIVSGTKVNSGTVLTITPTTATGYTTTASPTGSYKVTGDVTITFTRKGNTYYIYYYKGLATSGTLPSTQPRTYPKSSTIGTNSMTKTKNPESSYTVTYAHCTGSSGSLPSKQTSQNKFTYTANGWTTESNNVNDCDYTNGASYNAANNLTLYPNFTEVITNQGVTLATNNLTKAKTTNATYTVTFNANGGSVSKTSDTATKTTSYIANGWTTTKDSATKTHNNEAATGALSANLTLYPCFTAQTPVTTSIKLPTPTRSGYSFKGWATSTNATSGITGNYTPTASITLYAIWKPNGMAIANSNNTFSNYDIYICDNTTKQLNQYIGFMYDGSKWISFKDNRTS